MNKSIKDILSLEILLILTFVRITCNDIPIYQFVIVVYQLKACADFIL